MTYLIENEDEFLGLVKAGLVPQKDYDFWKRNYRAQNEWPLAVMNGTFAMGELTERDWAYVNRNGGYTKACDALRIIKTG